MDDDAQTKALFWEALWFYFLALRDEDFPCDRYTDGDGELPGMVPAEELSTWWRRHWISYEDNQLLRLRGMSTSPSGARVCAEGQCLPFVVMDHCAESAGDRIPVELDMDLLRYRTNGERVYVENMAKILAALLRRWWNKFEVSDDAVCFPRPLLPVNFHFVQKDSD